MVCENFFRGKGGTIDGLDCHTLEFYYTMNITGDMSQCRTTTDEGEKLVWLPVEQIPHSYIKPTFIREVIDQIIGGNETIHIIEERDR